VLTASGRLQRYIKQFWPDPFLEFFLWPIFWGLSKTKRYGPKPKALLRGKLSPDSRGDVTD
jgi:hypothetical protein